MRGAARRCTRTRRHPGDIVVFLRGIVERASTAQLARDLNLPRPRVYELEKRLLHWLRAAGARDQLQASVLPPTPYRVPPDSRSCPCPRPIPGDPAASAVDPPMRPQGTAPPRVRDRLDQI